MRIILFIAMLIFLVPFQGSSVNPSIFGIKPDFVLIAVYLYGTFNDSVKGGITGAYLGFSMDIASAGPVYFNVFSKAFTGYAAGVISRWIQNPGGLLHGIIIFIISILQGSGMLIAFSFLGTAHIPGDIIYIIIPQAVLDGIAGSIIYFIIIYIKERKHFKALSLKKYS